MGARNEAVGATPPHLEPEARRPVRPQQAHRPHVRPQAQGDAPPPGRRIEERRHMRPYVALIHRMPCCCELGVYRFDGGQTADPSDYRESMCGGRIEANHAGEKPGMGLKASDSTCIPMCSLHHKDWSEHRGLFALWTREERRAWADSVIKECRLAAIPTLFDEALDLQDLGLGTIEGTADAWRWVPAGAEAGDVITRENLLAACKLEPNWGTHFVTTTSAPGWITSGEFAALTDLAPPDIVSESTQDGLASAFAGNVAAWRSGADREPVTEDRSLRVAGKPGRAEVSTPCQSCVGSGECNGARVDAVTTAVHAMV